MWSRNSEQFGGKYKLEPRPEPYKSKCSQPQDEDPDLIFNNTEMKDSQLRTVQCLDVFYEHKSRN